MTPKELEEAIANLSIDDFDNKEEYRKYVVKNRRQLGAKMKEGVEIVLDENILIDYINLLMQEGYLALNKLPPVPEALKVKERSKSYRTLFYKVLSEYKYPESPRLIKISTDAIRKSACIADLRYALKQWKEVQELYAERDRLEDEVRMLDQQITFDTERDDLLEFYKQQNRELMEALTKDDEEYLLAKNVHELSKQGKGRGSISAELGITEKKVRVLLDKYKFS